MKNQQETAKKVFDSFQNLKSLQKVVSGIDFRQAKELSYMKEEDNYRIIMGDVDATWKSFIAQPELQPLTLQTAYRLTKIYDVYIKKLGLKEEDISGIDSLSLLRLARKVNKDNVMVWLNKAKNLSRSDLYRDLKYGNINENECEHQWDCKTTCRCKLCGATQLTKK